MGNIAKCLCEVNQEQDEENDAKTMIDGFVLKRKHKIFVEDVLASKNNFSSYIDLSKFAFYFGVQLKSQEELKKTWKNIDIEHRRKEFQREKINEAVFPRLKFAIRKGVPLDIIKKYILAIFPIDEASSKIEFSVAHKLVSEKLTSLMDHYPTFGAKMQIEDLLKHRCLNTQGVEELKLMLIIIKKQCSDLHYCPFLTVILGFLFIYLQREQVLQVIKTMMVESARMLTEEGQLNRAEELRGLRWYIPLDKRDYFSTVETFVNFMSEKSGSVRECLEHLENDLEADPKAFIQDQFNNFFLDYIPLDLMNTLFAIYLNEGIKILFRVGYAFFKTLKQEILCSSSFEEFKIVTTEILENLDAEGKKRFINTCFHLRIIKIRTQFSLIDLSDHDTRKSYICEPNVFGDTKIFPKEIEKREEMLRGLFSFLPSLYKSNDLKVIFTTFAEGRSLSHMINKAHNKNDDSVAFIMLVESDRGDIMGAFFQHRLAKTGSSVFLGSPENMVFVLKPENRVYKGVANENHIFFDYNGRTLFVGPSKEGCALLIDSDMQDGHTAATSAFENEPLTQDRQPDFHIKNLELFRLI